jgi:hypothetical protein
MSISLEAQGQHCPPPDRLAKPDFDTGDGGRLGPMTNMGADPGRRRRGYHFGPLAIGGEWSAFL